MENAILVDVQENVDASRGFDAEETAQWVTKRQEWFVIMPTRGREYEQGDQMQTELTHKARSHYFAGATTQMRLKQNGRIWDVVSVFNDRESNRWLVWELKENG